MAEPVRVLSEQPPETLYRPVSGLAIATFVIAVGYAIVVGGVAIIALASGTPVFLGTFLMIIPPAVAAALALAAWLQIRAAEGTRSGLALAKWAWWLTVFFGIGNVAVYIGTLAAVWWQADADIQRYFFDKIRAGKVDEAFAFTIDPEERAAASRREEMIARFGQPEGGKKSRLAQFREHEIVQFIRQGGSETKIKSLGLKDWEYKDKGYTVLQVYRITTPAGVMDAGLGVRSRESREFKGRRWQLLFNQAHTYVASRQKTPYGEKIETWRQAAHIFGLLWMRKQQEGDFTVVFLAAREPQERARLEREFWLKQVATSMAAAGGVMSQGGQVMPATGFLPLLDSRLACRLYLPGFAEFAAGDLVDAQEFEAPKNVKSAMLTRIKEAFLQPTAVGLRPQDDKGMLERLETEPHHVLVNFNIELAIFEPTNPATPKYRGQASLVLESDQDPMTSEAHPRWHVVKLKLFAGGVQSTPGQ